MANMELYNKINQYIDERYVPIQVERARMAKCLSSEVCMDEMSHSIPIEDIEDTFSQHLLKLIDTKELVDPDVYKKAGIDRKLFSKIRTDKFYKPSKKTAIALAIALELDLNAANELLNKAGYVLSRSSRFDMIIEYFIVHKIYDVFEINEALYYYKEALLKE